MILHFSIGVSQHLQELWTQLRQGAKLHAAMADDGSSHIHTMQQGAWCLSACAGVGVKTEN